MLLGVGTVLFNLSDKIIKRQCHGIFDPLLYETFYLDPLTKGLEQLSYLFVYGKKLYRKV